MGNCFNSRSLKEIDSFKVGKSFNISRKKKDKCEGEISHDHRSEDNQEKLGSKVGGVFTILMSVMLSVYFGYLMTRMYAGKDDNSRSATRANRLRDGEASV
jgi:hypothetical protein